MGYSAGLLNHRVTFAKRVESDAGSYGKSSGGMKYQVVGTFYAKVDFNKGVKSLREGAVDAYDTLMFRLHWRGDVDRWCLIKYNGKWYQIDSFNSDYIDNQLQITATEMANQNVILEESKQENTN